MSHLLARAGVHAGKAAVRAATGATARAAAGATAQRSLINLAVHVERNVTMNLAGQAWRRAVFDAKPKTFLLAGGTAVGLYAAKKTVEAAAPGIAGLLPSIPVSASDVVKHSVRFMRRTASGIYSFCSGVVSWTCWISSIAYYKSGSIVLAMAALFHGSLLVPESKVPAGAHRRSQDESEHAQGRKNDDCEQSQFDARFSAHPCAPWQESPKKAELPWPSR